MTKIHVSVRMGIFKAILNVKVFYILIKNVPLIVKHVLVLVLAYLVIKVNYGKIVFAFVKIDSIWMICKFVSHVLHIAAIAQDLRLAKSVISLTT